ncbi:MAG: LapA family protein [Fidelibacterota bacterium]
MVRIIVMFLVLLVLIALLWFLSQNVDQIVSELQIFTISLTDVNLVSIIFISFAIGIIVGFLIPVFQYIGAKGAVRKLRRENEKLRVELNDLRNVSISGEIAAPLEEIEEEEKGEGKEEEKTEKE